MLVRYVLTEYDPDRSWIVVGQEDLEVELAKAGDFYAWAAEHHQAPRWSAELIVGQLGHDTPSSGEG